MNARQLVEENEGMIRDIISTAKRVMKVRKITFKEAIEYGREVAMKYAKTDTNKAAVDLRYDKALESIEIVELPKDELFYQESKTDKYAIVNKQGKIFNPKGETWNSKEPIHLKTKSYLVWLRKKHVGHKTLNCEIKKLA